MSTAKTRVAQRKAWRIVKVIFAVTLASLAVAGISYRIAQMHAKAVAPVFDPTRDVCSYRTNGTFGSYARLEPPITVPFMGFSIDWQVRLQRSRGGTRKAKLHSG